MRRHALLLLFNGVVLAQSPGSVEKATPDNVIEGKIVNDLTGVPLRRAHVALRPTSTGSTIGAEADDHGTFVIRNVDPGRYSLFASRDGFLASSVCIKGTLRMPPVISVGAKQTIDGVTCRLRPSAVIAGKIFFDDGEPAINIRVDAYREARYRGRHAFSAVARAITNDRGEYRIFGLQPGAYTIAAAYERAPDTPGYKVQTRTDSEGREIALPTYTTTFFPNTSKLSEAVPIRVNYGDEKSSIDIFLNLVHKVKLRGQVTNGITGELIASASLFLQRIDAQNTGSLAVPVGAGFDRLKRFEIKDVTPGPYLLWADASDNGKRLVGRSLITVSSSDIENLELVVKPDQPWPFTVKVEGGGQLDPSVQLRVRLEPRSERGAISDSRSDRDSELPWVSVMADEIYDPYVVGLPDDFYISHINVNGTDVLSFGLDSNMASPMRPFEVVVDSRGGKVAGRVFGFDGNVWSGASVALIPDPPLGRLQAYRETYADEYGQFSIHGAPPGRYILVAWLDDPPCDYWDPDGLDGCRAAGTMVNVQQGGQENVALTMKTSQQR